MSLLLAAGGASPINYTLICNAGLYSYVGSDATLDYFPGAVNYTLECEPGAYVYTGNDAILTYEPGFVIYDTHDGFNDKKSAKRFKNKDREELRILLERAISSGKQTQNLSNIAKTAIAKNELDLSKEQVRQVIANVYTNVAIERASQEHDDEEAILILMQ